MVIKRDYSTPGYPSGPERREVGLGEEDTTEGGNQSKPGPGPWWGVVHSDDFTCLNKCGAGGSPAGWRGAEGAAGPQDKGDRLG